MTVELQPFVQPATPPRIPQDTVITNVIATCAARPTRERVYLISGHIDSRATDILNFDIEQPAANDDASGVAVVMELARVLSKRSPEATIVFTAVAGEEQAVRLRLPGRAVQGGGHRHPGHVLQRHRGQQHGRQRPARPAHAAHVHEGVPTSETTQQAAIRRATEARSTARRASSAASSSRWPRTTRPTCASATSTGATDFLRATTTSLPQPAIRRTLQASRRELRPRAPGHAGGERRAVRRPGRVRRLLLHDEGRQV